MHVGKMLTIGMVMAWGVALGGCGVDWFPAPKTTTSVLTVTTTALPNGTVGASYSQTLTATGGVAPYSWSVTSGQLPAGLTLSSGVISGTPTTAGSFTFTVTVSDASTPALTATRTFTVVIS